MQIGGSVAATPREARGSNPLPLNPEGVEEGEADLSAMIARGSAGELPEHFNPLLQVIVE